jgi:shikimate kinase
MKICLLGYMGSGKSTLGKKLAKRMDLEFIDLDQFIESDKGQTITDIFSTMGEGGFRKVEKEALASCLDKDNVLLSLGGGTPCYSGNMDSIKSNSISVYLDLSPKALQSRLIQGKFSRPLIANLNDMEMLSFIEDHLGERLVHYKRADIHFQPFKQDVDELIEEIQSYSK